MTGMTYQNKIIFVHLKYGRSAININTHLYDHDDDGKSKVGEERVKFYKNKAEARHVLM